MQFLKLLQITILACLFVPSCLLGQSDDPRLLTPEDFFELKQVANPVISPEGDWVAYTVRETKLEDDESETRIWMVSSDGDEVMPMTGVGSSASSPAWSPDGKYLSFLASRNDGETQVWGLNRRGGEAQQLTEIEQGVNGYAWSPDSRRLALLIRDPEDEDEEGSEDKEEPWVIDRLQFKRDYAGYLDRRRTHLYVFDLASDDKTHARQITSGDYDDSQFAW
ncbi:MAG: S9 family peptidase, partial [Gammaproteobacteria bacterium]|nr:S9 family peptidase [Gammaproteobacteria bacterium]